MLASETGIENPDDELRQSVIAELDDADKSLREVDLMLEQSQQELTKLAQRNTAISVHLQQVQKQIEGLPGDEIRSTFETALDAQQRLFVMRGQLEKLQSDRAHLDRYVASLKRTQALLDRRAAGGGKGGNGSVASMEMIIDAQETERQRLSRQMHDGPAQALSNFILQTEIAMRLIDVDSTQARNELTSLKASAMQTFQKVRNFIFELRPMMLDDLGLVPTIKRYTAAFNEQSGIDVNLNVSGAERRLEPHLEVIIFRALQELLGNAARHSQASLIKVHVDMAESAVKVEVEDNGKGFDTSVLKQNNSLGLRLIRDRVELLGGSFDISSLLGSGTTVTFVIPARSAAS
jgi:two-component system sensor histidine kinase DegS